MHIYRGMIIWWYVMQGYGFVDFESPTSALAAVHELQGQGIQVDIWKLFFLCFCVYTINFVPGSNGPTGGAGPNKPLHCESAPLREGERPRDHVLALWTGCWDIVNVVINSHILMTRNSPRHRPSLLSSFHYDHNHDRLCQLEFSGTPTNSLEGSGSPGWRVGTSVSR